MKKEKKPKISPRNIGERVDVSLLTAILQDAPVIIGFHDINNNILWTNKAYQEATGLSLEELKGKKCYKIWNLSRLCSNCPIIRALETGKPQEAELTPQNQVHWFPDQRSWLTKAVPVKDGKGNIIGAIEAAFDITEHKKADKALEKTVYDFKERLKELNCLYGLSKLVEKPNISLEEIYSGLVNLMPAAWQYPDITCARIVLKDKEFKTNNYKMTKWKQSSDLKLYGKKAGVVEVCYLEEKPKSFEGPFLNEERDLINAITERLGRITERKKAEEALCQANKRLKNLDQLKSNFVTNVSHEFRTPMTSIKGYTELILAGGAGEINHRQREFLTTVKNNTDHLTRLLGDLLDISRIEAGKVELNLENIDIPNLIQEIIKSYQVEAKKKQISLETDLPQKFPLLKADSDRIKQVLTNLFGNALKFIPPQGRIVFGFQEAAAEAIFWIEDTGPGIAPKDLTKIFEKFHQVKSKYWEKKKGTGLGLVIAKHLVELHKGRIWVKSTLGKGSTFYFTLPIERKSR
jgi:PAS domain S-box-containing protein